MELTEIINWITDNVTWIFSGIGVFILGFFITKKVRKKNSQTIRNNSSGIQAGRDVNVNTKR